MVCILPRGSFPVEDCRYFVLGHALFSINNPKVKVECTCTILQVMPSWGLQSAPLRAGLTLRGTRQVWEMGWQDPHQIQQGQMQSPPPGMASAGTGRGQPGWAAALLMGTWGSWLTWVQACSQGRQQSISSKLVLPFLTECLSVLKAQTVSYEVLMQLLDLAVSWLRWGHPWLWPSHHGDDWPWWMHSIIAIQL